MEQRIETDLITRMARDIAESTGSNVVDVEEKLRKWMSQTPYLDSMINGSAWKNGPVQDKDGKYRWTPKMYEDGKQ